MDHFPIFLALKDQRALIIGGGQLASRKAALIAKSGALITVIAQEFSQPMRALAQANSRITLSTSIFEARALNGVSLVLAATDDDELNRRVFSAASERGIPVNVADQPEMCSYILPAIVDRAPVIVAVSTGGRSPVLARLVKAMLERALPQSLGGFSQFLQDWRKPVADALPDGTQRRRFWERAINGTVGEKALAGDFESANQELKRQLQAGPDESAKGSLTLIGSPSDDPEMLSIKAHRLIQQAEWVFYDDNTPEALLELSRREANSLNVDRSSNAKTQEKILSLLQAGSRIVRVYGRDAELQQEATADRLYFARHEAEALCIAAPSQTYGAKPLSSADKQSYLPS